MSWGQSKLARETFLPDHTSRAWLLTAWGTCRKDRVVQGARGAEDCAPAPGTRVAEDAPEALGRQRRKRSRGGPRPSRVLLSLTETLHSGQPRWGGGCTTTTRNTLIPRRQLQMLLCASWPGGGRPPRAPRWGCGKARPQPTHRSSGAMFRGLAMLEHRPSGASSSVHRW